MPNAPHLQDVSPYVISPVTTSPNLQVGDTLTFDLLLFGKAVDYLPYLIISYRQLGSKGGLGRTRARFTLEEVSDETPGYIPQTLYAHESDYDPTRVDRMETDERPRREPSSPIA